MPQMEDTVREPRPAETENTRKEANPILPRLARAVHAGQGWGNRYAGNWGMVGDNEIALWSEDKRV
jgi:hypothetical protein